MRVSARYLTAALIATAMPLAAHAMPVQPDRGAAGSAELASAAYTCPPGYYWEPDAYAPHGKFRPAHCAPRW